MQIVCFINRVFRALSSRIGFALCALVFLVGITFPMRIIGDERITKEELLVIAQAARESIRTLDVSYDYVPKEGRLPDSYHVRTIDKQGMRRYLYPRSQSGSGPIGDREIRANDGKILEYRPNDRLAVINVDAGFSERDGAGDFLHDMALLNSPGESETIKYDSLESILKSEWTSVGASTVALETGPHVRIEVKFPNNPGPIFVVLLDAKRKWGVTEHLMIDAGSGKTLRRSTVTEKVQVLPDLWLPVIGDVESWDAEGYQKWSLVVAPEADSPNGYAMHLNTDLPDAMFDVSPESLPIGTSVIDKVAGKKYRVGAGRTENVRDLLAGTMDAAVRPPPQSEAGEILPPAGHSRTVLGVLGIVLLVGACAGVMVGFRMKRWCSESAKAKA